MSSATQISVLPGRRNGSSEAFTTKLVPVSSHLPWVPYHRGRDYPQPEKIQGTLNMQRPGTQKDVRRFVGMVNFYRDLFPKRAETLATLMDLCGQKKKFIVREIFPENENNLSSRDNAHLP